MLTLPARAIGINVKPIMTYSNAHHFINCVVQRSIGKVVLIKAIFCGFILILNTNKCNQHYDRTTTKNYTS